MEIKSKSLIEALKIAKEKRETKVKAEENILLTSPYRTLAIAMFGKDKEKAEEWIKQQERINNPITKETMPMKKEPEKEPKPEMSMQFPDVPQNLAETILEVLQNKKNDQNFIRRAISGWINHSDNERTVKAIKDMVVKLGVVEEVYDAAFRAGMAKYRYDNMDKAKDTYDAQMDQDKKKS